MRKQIKLISLVLVVAMLCSLLAVFAGADDTASVASEDFAPTATFEKLALEDPEAEEPKLTGDSNSSVYNATSVNVDGNLITYYGGTKLNDLDHYIVNEGDDSYALISANHTGTGLTDAQVSFGTAIAAFTGTEFYVADFDIAAESEFINTLYFAVMLRDKNGQGTATFAPSLIISSVVKPDGNWHHVTVVGDVAGNKMYVYVDGALSTTAKATNLEGGFNAETGLTATGVKFSYSKSKSIDKSQHFYLDNVSHRVISDTAEIAAVVTSGDITSWSQYQAHKGGSLPAAATVGGKQIGAQAFNSMLSSYVPFEATLIRDAINGITVNADAVIDTNGFVSNLVAGEGVTVTTRGNVHTYDAPHKSSMVEKHLVGGENSTDNQDLFDATANITSDIKKADGNTYPADGLALYLVNELGSNEKYVEFRVVDDTANFASGKHYHINWNSNSSKAVFEKDTYLVLEYDLYSEEFIGNAYFNVVSRNGQACEVDGQSKAAASNIGGTSYQFKSVSLPTGEWVHITAIGSVNDNTLKLYANGSLIHTIQAGLWNKGATYDDALPYFEGLRLNFSTSTKDDTKKGQTVAIDNVTIRYNYTDDGIAAAYASTSLNGWDGTVYGKYDTAPIPAVVTVDGVKYSSAKKANEALVGNFSPVVNVYRDFTTPLHINCDATVYTNGHNVTVTTVPGAEITNNSDGSVTYNVPFVKSSVSVNTYKAADVLATLKSSYPENIFKSVQWDSTMNAELNVNADGTSGAQAKGYIVTNSIDGNQYVVYDGTYVNANGIGVNDHSNSYFEIQAMVDLTKVEGKTQYLIFDFDFAVLDNSNGGSIPFMSVQRNSAGGGLWGASNPSLNNMMAGYSEGQFHHITVVYDIDNNKCYPFTNGNLLSGSFNYTGDNNHSGVYAAGNLLKFNGIRIGSNSKAKFAVGEATVRQITEDVGTTEAGSLTAALNAKEIYNWSGAIKEVTAKIAPVATINGEYHSVISSMQNTLKGNGYYNVEFLDDAKGTLEVGVNATVNTNGLNVDVKIADDCEYTKDGNVYTVVAPYRASAASEAIVLPADKVDVYNSSYEAIKKDSANLIGVNNSILGGSFYFNNWESLVEGSCFTPTSNNSPYLTLRATKDGKVFNNPYISITGTATTINTTDYYVIDVDLASETEFINGFTILPVIRAKNSSNNTEFLDVGTDAVANLVSADGRWHHLTVIGDMANNVQYTFVDGALVMTQKAYQNDNYTGHTSITIDAIRIGVGTNVEISKNQTMAFDNISYRLVSANDELAEALSEKDILSWSGSVAAPAAEALPPIAVLNGVEYSNVYLLGENLNGEGTAVLSIEREFPGTVKTNQSIKVNHHNLYDGVVYDTGITEINGMLVTGFYSKQPTGDTEYLLSRLNENNIKDYCVEITWYSATDLDVEETIYYPIGTQISYVGNQIKSDIFEYGNVIKNGKLHTAEWFDVTESDEGVKIDSFGVATKGDTMAFYYEFRETAIDTDVSIAGNKLSVTINTNLSINLYVPAELTEGGEDATLGDNLYKLFKAVVKANETAKTVSFYVPVVSEGVTYYVRVDASIVGYAEELLSSEQYSDVAKRAMMAALLYSSEAYALAGEESREVEAILANEAYAQYKAEIPTEFGEVKDTAALGEAIRGAQMYLSDAPAFVLNFKSRYEGRAVNITYNVGDKQVTETYTVTNNMVILENIKAYYLAGDLTITVGNISGEYNLATYIAGVEDNEFAKALYVYANAAHAYKLETEANA